MPQPNIDEACPFCGRSGGLLVVDHGARALYVQCGTCLARGPAIDGARADARAQALAAWAAGKKFGRIAIANVPGGMPSFTCSLAERVRLVAESLYKGDLGEAESAVMIFKTGGRAHTITHNISNSDVIRVLDAVRDASRVRVATLAPPKPRG